MLKRLTILAAFLVASASMSLAHEPPSPNPACSATEAVHDYGPLDTGAARSISMWRSPGTPATVVVSDGNLCDIDGNGLPNDFDGEYEHGTLGGFFPAGIYAEDPVCDHGYVAHHGPDFQVVSSIPAGVPTSFTVGADASPPTLLVSLDPADDDGFECVTDGAVSPDVDPDDCLERFIDSGTTSCIPGSDGGWWVWVDCVAATEGGDVDLGLTDADGDGVPDDANPTVAPPTGAATECSTAGHIFNGGGGGGPIEPEPLPTRRVGHITIHKWPGANGVTGDPTILMLPAGWTCEKVVNGVVSPAAVRDTLPNSGDQVRGAPPDSSTTCTSVTALGYAAGAGSGGTVTVTAACTGLATAAAFTTPGGTDRSHEDGLGTMPLRCIVSWTAINAQDDWWAHCEANTL